MAAGCGVLVTEVPLKGVNSLIITKALTMSFFLGLDGPFSADILKSDWWVVCRGQNEGTFTTVVLASKSYWYVHV
jgi:hypothetical protein